MKKEFLNFTGSSWGEYSNTSGRAVICNDPAAVNYGEQGECIYLNVEGEMTQAQYSTDPMGYLIELIINQYGCFVFTVQFGISDLEFIVHDMLYQNPLLGYEFNFPSQEIGGALLEDIVIAGMDSCYAQPNPPSPSEQGNSCESYMQAFQFLQNNSLNTSNTEPYWESIMTLMGGWQNAPVEVGTYEGTVDYVDTGDEEYVDSAMAASEMMANCNTFMDWNCADWYSQEEVANTLAQAILSLNDFVYGVIDGSIVIEGYTISPEEPFELLEAISDLITKVLELEMECNTPDNIPMVVEQAVGQITEQYVTFLYNNGYLENAGSMSLEEVMCMDEYYHNDSFAYIWEILNYTPTMCGGVGCPDCPDCPDCGTTTDCPDCNCDCPDPCPQGGGITGGNTGGKPPRPPKTPARGRGAAIRRRR